MRWYKVEKANSKKKIYKCSYEKLSTSVSFWEKCKLTSKKDKIKVRYMTKLLSKNRGVIVTNAIFEFPDGECWIYSMK